MKLLPILALAAPLLTAILPTPAAAQQTPPSTAVEKINAYVGCINRLSERSYDSRRR